MNIHEWRAATRFPKSETQRCQGKTFTPIDADGGVPCVTRSPGIDGPEWQRCAQGPSRSIWTRRRVFSLEKPPDQLLRLFVPIIHPIHHWKYAERNEQLSSLISIWWIFIWRSRSIFNCQIVGIVFRTLESVWISDVPSMWIELNKWCRNTIAGTSAQVQQVNSVIPHIWQAIRSERLCPIIWRLLSKTMPSVANCGTSLKRSVSSVLILLKRKLWAMHVATYLAGRWLVIF